MSRKSMRARAMGRIVKLVHEEYHCVGYFGFGTGVSSFLTARRRVPTLACNECPAIKECFEAHKVRTKALLPDLTTEFTRMVDENPDRGDLASIKFHAQYGVVDPYTIIMSGNVEDGVLVASGQKPKDRGEYTLEYPFTGN